MELTLVTPLLLLFLLFVVTLGRLTFAHQQVEGATRDAARAASLSRSAAGAQAAAQSAADESLSTGGASCRSADVNVDTSSFRAGGWVAVDVTCHADLADLSLLRIPGQRDVHARFVAPIDTYVGVS